MAMNKMPPPGSKPSLVIAVGADKSPKGPSEDAPKPSPDPSEPDGDDEAGGKISPDKAMVIRGDQHCANCSNYHGEDGSCEKVDGQFSPDDSCWVFFDAMSDEAAEGEGAPADDAVGKGLGQSSWVF